MGWGTVMEGGGEFCHNILVSPLSFLLIRLSERSDSRRLDTNEILLRIAKLLNAVLNDLRIDFKSYKDVRRINIAGAFDRNYSSSSSSPFLFLVLLTSS